jgi:hypothetical protein
VREYSSEERDKLKSTSSGNLSGRGSLEGGITALPCCAIAIVLSALFAVRNGIVDNVLCEGSWGEEEEEEEEVLFSCYQTMQRVGERQRVLPVLFTIRREVRTLEHAFCYLDMSIEEELHSHVASHHTYILVVDLNPLFTRQH